MSCPPSLEFDKKYMDYVSECPVCKSKDIKLMCPTSSPLSDVQICEECKWMQKIYHKYYEKNENIIK